MHWKSNLFSLISTLAVISFLILRFPNRSQPPSLRRGARALQTLDTHLQFIHWACEDTRHRDLCISTLTTTTTKTTKSTSVPQLIASIIATTLKEVNISSSACSAILHRRGLTPRERRAVGDCIDLLNYTANELISATADLTSSTAAGRHIHDLQTLLSAAMTNQYTCLDGFAYGEKDRKVREYIERNLYNISQHVSNSLSMLRKITPPARPSAAEEGVLFPEYGSVKDGFPTWISREDRGMLQAAVNETKFDLVVAKDGSGNFTTIGEAVQAAPNSSTTRFVIHIKAGAYFENVEVVKKKTNLMFVGDGIGKTVVKANRNVVDGWTTFRSATVAVVGDGFLAKGITFENSAGPSKHQAVALRSGSDLSAFYQCSFVGYQDTLYVHSLRQFYRDCDVYGTVDFIFGNAAVVLQGCSLYPRKPNPNQKNIVTAQGREDPNQNTGISVINCKIVASSDLAPVKSAFKTYLGRPWKQYSRTVIMKTYIDDVVDPAGWLEWNGSFALDTLYYGEYMNRGPGSNTSSRVNWTGFRVINSSAEATQFTVGPFIQGTEWLNATSFPFSLGI